MTHGLYQCPQCFGPSDGPGSCRSCLGRGISFDYAAIERRLLLPVAMPVTIHTVYVWDAADPVRSAYGIPVATESFTCPRCGMTSYNPNDIREGYCGNCHDWTRT